ncbi:Uncharacterized protein Fot_37666 [Forsythia ovata]|uniref:Uncharacterized protein n=1 Tax=Forsythia ovata TaxID=205694 RepID=A0ABD1RZL7_9LAMI
MDEREIPSLKLLILSTAFIPTSTVPWVVGVVGNVSSSIPVPSMVHVPVAIVHPVVRIVEIELSYVPSVASVEQLEGVEHQVKGKWVDKWEKVAPKRALEDEGDTAGSANVNRGGIAPPQETTGSILLFQAWCRYPFLILLIGPNVSTLSLTELDQAILEKLLHSSAMATTSVHKNWTSIWAKVTESVDLLELIKMVEMNTAWSHVLNCELYKVFAMEVDELRSKVVGTKDIDALRLENKALYVQLAVAKDARARSEVAGNFGD